MKLQDIFKTLKRNTLWLLLFPLALAGAVAFFTKDEAKTYTSSFMVYTGLASGANLTSEANPRTDHYQINNAFDNLLTTLKSRETLEEVSLRLLAQHLLMEKPDKYILSPESFQMLQEVFPPELRRKMVDSTVYGTILNLKEIKASGSDNPVSLLLNSGNNIYGVSSIRGRIQAKRQDNSDMIEVIYSASDPAVCQQTLKILSGVFLSRYKALREGEINKVVKYFAEQTEVNRSRLRQAEDRLKDFGVKNRIINYTEQTKNLSDARQMLRDQIRQEKMQLASAEAVVSSLDNKVKGRKAILDKNQEIVRKRKELSELNYKIANGNMNRMPAAELNNLKEQAEDLKSDIRSIVGDAYGVATPDNIPGDDLLSEWLENMLAVDESSAKLRILEDQMKNYESEYDQYAPLGATLGQLEREVQVSESEYLASLNALNVNRQRQQDVALSSTIKLVDEPFFPAVPNPTKRMFLIIISFFAGLFLIGGIVVARDFLDESIKTPRRAEKITGAELAGVFPEMAKSRKYDMPYLENSLLEQTATSVILNLSKREKEYPRKIMISSTRVGDGKVWSATKLACKLTEISGRVLLVYPNVNKLEVNGLFDKFNCQTKPVTAEYPVKENFIDVENLKELIPEVNLKDFKYIITVIPALAERQIPVGLVKEADLPMVVVQSARTWSESDSLLMKLFRKAAPEDPVLLLNRVALHNLERVYGQLPKKGKSKKEEPKANTVEDKKQPKSARA